MPSKTFSYIKYDQTSIEKQERCKELVEALESQVERLGAGHYQQQAMDHLEIFYMMVGKAIRDDQLRRGVQTEHSPERGE